MEVAIKNSGGVNMEEAKLKVELIAYTPDPVGLCSRAAGICYDKEEKENPSEFIKKIIKSGHESVIEHASFTFRVEGVSRALTHQWVRHRICSFSQRSQRYVKEGEKSYIKPTFDYINNEPNPTYTDGTQRARVSALFDDAMEDAWKWYRALLQGGAKPEDARFVLPNACETKMVWTTNARELRHFFKLRMDKHAQWEIRKMANWMFNLVMDVAGPLFEDLSYLRKDSVH
jgi:thymidylate synthase (FAD)